MIYDRQLNRFVSRHDHHQRMIKVSYRKLASAIKAYMVYLYKELTKRVKRDKVDHAFVEKLGHWRANNGLTVVTGDNMNPTKSMADGKYYTSRKKMRQEQAAQGFEEVGNDKQEHLKADKVFADQARTRDIKQDIERAIYG